MPRFEEHPSDPNPVDIAGAPVGDDMRDADARGDATLVAIHYESEMTDSERETIESQRFRDFLPTKNGCMVFDLVGHDNIG